MKFHFASVKQKRATAFHDCPKYSVVRETLIKSNSTRSNALFHGSEFDTLCFNQRILSYQLSITLPDGVKSGAVCTVVGPPAIHLLAIPLYIHTCPSSSTYSSPLEGLSG